MTAKKRKTSENNRKFKGVWIPAEYWLDENLSILEVVILTEIDSLDGKEGCFASNKRFADFIGMSTAYVSKIIKSLKGKGYITVHYQKQDNNVTLRTIRIVKGINYSKGSINYSKSGINHSVGGINYSVTSNTSSNTSNSNTVSQSSKDTSANIKDPFDNISNKDRQTKVNKLINSITDNCGIPISDNQRQQITKLLLELTIDDAEAVVNKVEEFASNASNPVGYIIQSIKNRKSEM